MPTNSAIVSSMAIQVKFIEVSPFGLLLAGRLGQILFHLVPDDARDQRQRQGLIVGKLRLPFGPAYFATAFSSAALPRTGG